MKRILSTIFSVISVCALIYINIDIANRYVNADGKTQALFGIIELLEYSYRYLILIPGILSLVLAGLIIWSKDFKLWDILTTSFALLAIVGALTPSWRLFI